MSKVSLLDAAGNLVVEYSTKDFEKIKKAESYYWRNVRHQFPKQLIAPIVKDGIKSLPSAVFIDTAIRGVKATIFT